MGFEGAELAVVPLDAERAKDAAATGAKAAYLVCAAVAGPPVLPGVVLVPADRAPGAATGEDAVRSAWRAPAGPEERALVVRSSSSAHEDTDRPSAGTEHLSEGIAEPAVVGTDRVRSGRRRGDRRMPGNPA
ncbi:hypothetical protein ACFXPN_04305 [Streptomyces griseorubiginosus]|uniref:hypothetical protein n=1 Tax=Streptomyces griseorubiginosus TaxID=67304 RepID=UPI0036A5AF24